MKITTRTCYFLSIALALNYYSGYKATRNDTHALVDEKLKNKKIHIGNPPLKDGQEKRLIDNRWHICEISSAETK